MKYKQKTEKLKGELMVIKGVKIKPNFAALGRVNIPHSGKHQSAGRKTLIRGKENADPHKERSNSPKERTSCII